MALLHFISHGKRQKLHLYIHIMNKKKLKLCHCKIWHNFFFGVHNVNNAIFTYDDKCNNDRKNYHQK